MNPNQLAEVLRTLLDRGFAPPLVVTAVGANGSVLVMRMTLGDEGSLNGKVVAEETDGRFLMPTNILLVDAKGEAARVTIEGESVVYN